MVTGQWTVTVSPCNCCQSWQPDSSSKPRPTHRSWLAPACAAAPRSPCERATCTYGGTDGDFGEAMLAGQQPSTLDDRLEGQCAAQRGGVAADALTLDGTDAPSQAGLALLPSVQARSGTRGRSDRAAQSRPPECSPSPPVAQLHAPQAGADPPLSRWRCSALMGRRHIRTAAGVGQPETRVAKVFPLPGRAAAPAHAVTLCLFPDCRR